MYINVYHMSVAVLGFLGSFFETNLGGSSRFHPIAFPRAFGTFTSSMKEMARRAPLKKKGSNPGGTVDGFGHPRWLLGISSINSSWGFFVGGK